MYNFIKKFFLFTALILSFTLIFSCKKTENRKKQQKTTKNDNFNLPTKLRKLDDMTIKYIDGKNIILILGYGFNDKETVEKIKQNLNSSFGLESEDKSGLVSLYIFPDDFGKNGKISLLESMIEKKDVIGMIIFGAPEKTHKTISDMKDKNENRKLSYPVYSFFPQDDILGSQYISDFVVDYAGNTDVGVMNQLSDSENEKSHAIPNFETSTVITNAVQVILTNSSNSKKEEVISMVQKIIGQKHKISKYIDPETKIAAVNHFTFE